MDGLFLFFDSFATINDDGSCLGFYEIPDTGFVAYLEDNYPEVIQNGLLNIGATESIDYLNIYDDWTNPIYNINSIDGIQYFLNLESIYSSTGTLTSFIFSDLNMEYIMLDETNLIDVQITNSNIQENYWFCLW